MLSVYEITKKKLKIKLLQGLKSEETKNCNKTTKACNCRKPGAIGGTVRWRHEQCSQENHSCSGAISSIFCYSFPWSLICNAEFDLNSSCLDRLNNFGII